MIGLITFSEEFITSIIKDLLISKNGNPDFNTRNINNTAIICKETLQSSSELPKYYGFTDVRKLKLFEMIS